MINGENTLGGRRQQEEQAGGLEVGSWRLEMCLEQGFCWSRRGRDVFGEP